MRTLFITVLSAVALTASVANATQNVGDLTCLYTHEASGWVLFASRAGSDGGYSLADGAEKESFSFAVVKQTPEYGVCISKVGTESDHIVKVHTQIFEATKFKGFGPNCEAIGTNVKKTTDTIEEVIRAEYAEVSGLSLHGKGPMTVKTYFPTAEEANHIQAIAVQKCTELKP